MYNVLRDVTNNLSVGDVDDATRHATEYDAVVSMAATGEYTTHEYVIEDGNHSYDTYAAAVTTVIDLLDENESVLVHCQAGMSRSVSVVAAVHAVTTETSIDESFRTVRHGFINPAPELRASAEEYVSGQEEGIDDADL